MKKWLPHRDAEMAQQMVISKYNSPHKQIQGQKLHYHLIDAEKAFGDKINTLSG